MAKILLWMSPESGHLLPTIKFATDLRNRGHRVVYLTCGLIRRELEALGFETIGFFDGHPAVANRSVLAACAPAGHMYEQIWRSLIDSRQYIQEFRGQINHAARRICADLTLIDGVFDSVLKLNISALLGDVCPVARVQVYLPYYQSPVDYGAAHSGAVIYLAPRAFEIPSRVQQGVVYTEASVFQGEYGSHTRSNFWGGVCAERPVVYCSLGTQAALYSSTLSIFDNVFGAAASLPDFTFVLACGSAYRHEYADRAPNVRCAPFVPLMEVLQRAKVAILNGGFGTIKACIYLGVPMLIIPQQWDQPANAARIRYHGIGESLENGEVTASAIARMIEGLAADRGIAERMRRMQRLFLETERLQLTAEVCESILAGLPIADLQGS